MATTTKLAPQLHRIAAQWPSDPFRPHLQLKAFLKSLADHPQLTPQAVQASRALEANEFQKKVWHLTICLRCRAYPSTVPPVGKDAQASLDATALHQTG